MVGSRLPMQVLQVWGSNTGVGKTIVCGGLARVWNGRLNYLKPVQTGFPEDDDAQTVVRLSGRRDIAASVMIGYGPAISPHRAWSGQPVEDGPLLERVRDQMRESDGNPMLLETAGGVLSPVPSGTLQADAYRPLRLPSLLVGDGRLGGISATLSAYEALIVRGYDVPFIFMVGMEHENHIKVAEASDAKVFAVPLPSDELHEEPFDHEALSGPFTELSKETSAWWENRDADLASAADRAKAKFWWPFTQHGTTSSVTVIDSAHGDDFAVAIPEPDGTGSMRLDDQFDACASWWTSGVGHGNSALAKRAAHAAGRYGHVIFPEAAHQPALELSELLLDTVGESWASRVFYSDDGSTAVEVGLKMVLRKRAFDLYGARDDYPWQNMKVIALEGSYHGDTLGVMDCSPSSVFNQSQMPWYRPRGIFLSPPLASQKDGTWTVWSDDTRVKALATYAVRDQLFELESRLHSPLADQYRSELSEVFAGETHDIGALLMEPVLQGAGGMRFIDPLYQRVLADECSKRGIPVLLDEVFTGLWRLGSPSAAKMLGIKPDATAFAKLITGGLVPLAATLASEEVFDVFRGDRKQNALLHGHSYTAHPVGCEVGTHAIKQYVAAFRQRQGDSEFWGASECDRISRMENVAGVVNLGTVLAVEIVSEGSGYSAQGSVAVAHALRTKSVYARPLGNTVYIMCSPLTAKDRCSELAKTLETVLADAAHRPSQAAAQGA